MKIRDEAVVRSQAVYLALAVLPDGTRDVLGIWIAQTAGATFWLTVFTGLKTRGCYANLIAVTDGLKGMRRRTTADSPQYDTRQSVARSPTVRSTITDSPQNYTRPPLLPPTGRAPTTPSPCRRRSARPAAHRAPG